MTVPLRLVGTLAVCLVFAASCDSDDGYSQVDVLQETSRDFGVGNYLFEDKERHLMLLVLTGDVPASATRVVFGTDGWDVIVMKEGQETTVHVPAVDNMLLVHTRQSFCAVPLATEEYTPLSAAMRERGRMSCRLQEVLLREYQGPYRSFITQALDNGEEPN